MQTLIITESEQQTEQIGHNLSQHLNPGLQIHLNGDLGAGKSVIVRGIIKGFGYDGGVQSPTFTLVEPYSFEQFTIYHFDFYRLEDAQELEMIGFREYLNATDVCIIEWPQRAQSLLPVADVVIDIGFTNNPQQREINIQCLSKQSVALCKYL